MIEIIAEVAQGYEGSAKLVELSVKSAAAAGADAVKFQIFYADELALPDYQYYDLFKSLELPVGVWQEAVDAAHEKGLTFYADVFGEKSLRDLGACGVDGYKIHATDINNTNLLEQVAESKPRVLLSTGGRLPEEIAAALEIFDACDVTLMYGFQAEPTELADNHLNRISALKELYGKPVGFQDHTAGDSEMAFYVPFLAMGMGVNAIEKHLTLSRIARMEDYVSGLTGEEFARWAGAVKQAYACLGKSEWILTEKEREYRAKVSRAVCARKKIAKGDTILKADLTWKRTGSPNAICNLSEVIGKTATRPIPDNAAVTRQDIL